MTYFQVSFFGRWCRTALLAATLFVIGGGQVALAQRGPSLRSVERPIRISLDPTYQRYESADGQVLAQTSTRLRTQVPITSRLTVGTQAGFARMGGEGLAQVQGLTDVTGRVTYAQPIGEGSLVMSAAVNAPVGKQELEDADLTTARLVSQNYYDFEVTSFSRGLSVSPRVTWAHPVTDWLAVGVGVGYQHHRGFRPRAGMDSDYVPGDGIGVHGGADVKIAETSALGVDVAMKRYGTDRLGGDRRFEAGTRLAGTLRYLQRSGFTTIRAVLRYANWEESTYGYHFGQGPTRVQVIPSHAMVLGSYQTRIRDGIRLAIRMSGHRYAPTIRGGALGEAKTVGRAYLSPAFDLGETLTLAPHGQVTYGSYVGFGGGIRIESTF